MGHTLVIEGRRQARKLFRLPRSARAANASAAYGVFRGASLREADDSLWAEMAHSWGFDSVQILKGYDSMPELLVSRLVCLNRRRPIRLCPPVELRTGEGATLPCTCSERSSMLNCGA